MRRRMLLGIAVSLGAGRARAAGGWLLVSPEEVRRDRLAPPRPQLRGLPPAAQGIPDILVDMPDADRTLHPPLNFRVRFVAAPGAQIDPRSFRARYGFLGIDITARLLQHARLSAQSLAADDINIPAGEHRVTLDIADTLARESSRTFRFTVV